MSSTLLIFIGENQKFDLAETISAIRSIPGVSSIREGEMIGAVLECLYTEGDCSTIVRISHDIETVTVGDFGDESLSFALQLQSRLHQDLTAIDMNYSFHISLREINSVEEFKVAISDEQ